jgi:hypothetical protein
LGFRLRKEGLAAPAPVLRALGIAWSLVARFEQDAGELVDIEEGADGGQDDVAVSGGLSFHGALALLIEFAALLGVLAAALFGGVDPSGVVGGSLCHWCLLGLARGGSGSVL